MDLSVVNMVNQITQLLEVKSSQYLLGMDDFESLLHLSAFVAPGLFICDQRNVRMLSYTLITGTAVHTAAVFFITQVVIAAEAHQWQ